MKQPFVILGLPLVILLWTSCSSMYHVQPLETETHALSLSFGGPLFNNLNEMVLPMPLLDLNYSYGMTENLTLGGSLHLTHLVFGTGHMELSGLYGITSPRKAIPGLSIYGSMHSITDFQSTPTFYPELTLIPYWEVGKNALVYTGVSSTYNLYPEMSTGMAVEHRVIPSFMLGMKRIGENWDWGTEIRLFHPWYDTYSQAVGYQGINGYGAWGIYFNGAYHFGGES